MVGSVKNAPDASAAGSPFVGFAEPVNPFVGGARAALGQGLGMGWGDEAEAWLRSKLTNQPYDETLAKIKSEYGAYAKQHPVQQTGLELAGGFLPTVASYLAEPFTGGAATPAAVATTARTAGALSKLSDALRTAGSTTLARIPTNPYARSATTGAVTGGITGAGSAEEGGRAEGAGWGALVGTGVGTAVPAVLRGGSGVVNWLRERVAPTEALIEKKAAGKMTQALEDSGMTPADIQTKLAEDKTLNVPSMLMNTGEGLTDLGETVAQRGGKGARTMEQNLREQKAGSRERTYQQTKEGLNAGNYYTDEEKMVNDLRARANNLYKEAYKIGDINDPKINAILEDPHFAEFYEKAKAIYDKKALAAKMRGEDPSQYELKPIYRITNNPDGTVKGIEKIDVPDVKTLDFIKQGIDETIEAAYKKDTPVSRKQAEALKDLKNAFVARIDEVTTPAAGGESPYKIARQKYAGDSEILDAMRQGMNEFGKMDHEQVIKAISKMSDAEKDAFRTGVTRDIYSKIMDPASNINAAQRIIGSPEMQAKLQPLFDSPEKFNLFKTALERESQLYHEANKVLGGSQTGKRLQMRENFEGDSGVGDIVAHTVSGGFFNSLPNIAARAIRNANVTDATADKLAKMLVSKDPTEVAAVVKTLEDYSKQSAKSAERLGKAELATTAGINTAFPPAPEAPPEENVDIESALKARNEMPTTGPDIEEALAARNRR